MDVMFPFWYICATDTVGPMKYADGFVVLSFVLIEYNLS